MKVTMTVNRSEVTAEVAARTLLVHFVRDAAGLTAINVGRGTTSCGACTIPLAGQSGPGGTRPNKPPDRTPAEPARSPCAPELVDLRCTARWVGTTSGRADSAIRRFGSSPSRHAQ